MDKGVDMSEGTQSDMMHWWVPEVYQKQVGIRS